MREEETPLLRRCGRRLAGSAHDAGCEAHHSHGHPSPPDSHSGGGRSQSSRVTHRISVPGDLRPGEWFRAPLPGYEPPRWVELQLPKGLRDDSDLEVTVSRLRESVYAIHARRGPVMRFLCTFVPTAPLFFIWALVKPANALVASWSR